MYIICLVCLTVSVDLPRDGETPLKVIKAIFCIINLIKMQNEQYMYMKAYFFHFWIFSIWFVLIDILFLWGVGVLCCQCLSAWAKDQDRFQQPTLGVFLSHYWTMIRTGSMWPPAPPAYVIIQTFRQSVATDWPAGDSLLCNSSSQFSMITSFISIFCWLPSVE